MQNTTEHKEESKHKCCVCKLPGPKSWDYADPIVPKDNFYHEKCFFNEGESNG
jgi:hypothetical protein